LVRHETIVAESCADVAVLEGVGSNCDGAWQRKCHFSAGKSDGDAGGDRVLNLMMS
jgi:hypothetical protein